MYELYDLEADPNELRNLANDSTMFGTLRELKEALQEKMIVDFDYLPLPIPGGAKKAKNLASVANTTAILAGEGPPTGCSHLRGASPTSRERPNP